MNYINGVGFTQINYPTEVLSEVRSVQSQWENFCKLPRHVKNKVPYANNVGYENKNGSGNKGDKKENIQITKSMSDILVGFCNESGQAQASELFLSMTGLVGMLEPLLVNYAHGIEEQLGVKGLARELVKGKDEWWVRFIHYPSQKEIGAVSAVAHIDKNGPTMHLFESHKGLEFLNSEGQWIPMPVSEKEMVVIPGARLQLRARGKLKGLYHRVVVNEQTEKEGRFSAVCFTPLVNTPEYNKDKHGRLQEFPVGFNYSMKHEEFAKLFK